MNILHLIDPGWPGGGGGVLRSLAGAVAGDRENLHDVLVLGTGAQVEIALRCGVRSIGSVALRSSRSIRKVVGQYERVRGRYDLVHSWTERAAIIAVSSLSAHRHLVSVAADSVIERFVAQLKGMRARIVAPFEFVRSEYEALGVPASLIDVVPPGFDTESVLAESGNELRRRWKSWSGDTVDRSFIVGFLGDDVRRVDADAAMSIAARLTISGKRVRTLVHPDAHRRAEAELNSHRMGFREEVLIVDDQVAEPWRIAAGLNAAIQLSPPIRSNGALSRGRGGLMPLLCAMAAGVPVIAEDAGPSREVIEDGVDGFLIPPLDINAACDRIDRLCDDPKLARRLGEAAATRVRDRFSPRAFRDGLMRAYERAIAG